MAALGGETDLHVRVRKRVAEQVFQQLDHHEHGYDDIRIMQFMSNVNSTQTRELCWKEERRNLNYHLISPPTIISG